MKVIIAGGGTGGHLFPGIAIAEEISRRNQDNEILFIGTDRGLEKRILHGMGYRLQTIDVAGIRGMGVMKTMGNIMKIPMSIVQSRNIIGSFNPHAVIGVGGYASGPAVIAAHYMGIATAIAEQNAVPGMTNRILGRFVDRIYVTFPETARWFNTNKVLVTGNPVRKSFVERKSGRRVARSEHLTILIFGGSQGAHAINDAVVAAMPLLKKIQGPLRFIHQTGSADAETVADAYRAHGIDARVSPFINDMATAYDEADLLVCRAGATTVAEVMVSGKPAIFIPFAHAVGDHQRLNAQVLVDAGAAKLILEKDLTGEALADMLQWLLKDREILAAMGERARASGTADAATRIVDDCWHTIGRTEW
ncbi:MAG: undecaprenyldiphospho-muramoylpentapeptide beta-N-acetylglucosaminyltransferase [Deltaproteobacteria bacterium]|nr:undecaprenyldiphospho-muramoylpentapeptide beta-N-acetylglucosaminyltransferase [Deltaproteobacteria bacterium]